MTHREFDEVELLTLLGGLTVYCFGDPAKMSDPSKRLALRIHDEVRQRGTSPQYSRRSLTAT